MLLTQLNVSACCWLLDQP
ncbi:hypothetical protein ACHEXF_23245 [Heyndrickxia oleronia]